MSMALWYIIPYLKVLMDEIFGRENFRNKITWKRRGGSANPTNKLNNVTDYILWYSKSELLKFEAIYTLDDKHTQNYIKERFVNIDESGRKFMKSPIQSPNPRPKLMYDYKGYKVPINGWSISKNIMEQWDKEGKLWFPEDKNKNINRKIYLDEYKGQPVSSLWTDISVINPMSKERGKFEGGQKPEALIKRLMEMTTSRGDLVLDFFVGSGTTCAAAHKFGRQYIGIEQMNYIDDITVTRLGDVIKGDAAGISKDVKWKGGGSFVYCELAQHNSNVIDKIELAATTEALKVIWQEMEKTDFISYKITPESINQNIHEFKALHFEEQKQFLIAVLDKNQLYVNYSEIDDEDYAISDADKKLNKQFYGEV